MRKSPCSIWTRGDSDGAITGNRIRGIVVEGLGWGIYNEGVGRVVMTHNELLGRTQAGDGGIRCADAKATAIGNSVLGYSTGIQGCTKGAGNSERP